jgi:hypothetical protein
MSRAVMPGRWWGSPARLDQALAGFNEASGIAKFITSWKEPEKKTRFVTGMTSYQKPHP